MIPENPNRRMLRICLTEFPNKLYGKKDRVAKSYSQKHSPAFHGHQWLFIERNLRLHQ